MDPRAAPRSRPRILSVTTDLSLSGGKRVMVDGAIGIDRTLFDTSVLLLSPVPPDNTLRAELEAAGVPVHHVPVRSRLHWSGLRALSKWLREEAKPDLIHTHTARSAAIARLACWGRGERPRLVVHFHGTVSHRALRPKNRVLEHMLRSRVDLVLAPTLHAAMRGAHVHAFRGLPVRVLPNGVDLSRLVKPEIAPAEVRRRWGIPEDAKVVLLLGRWTWVKGHDLLLDAIPTVLACPSDVRFVFVGPEGGGEFRAWLERRIGSTALRRFVIVAGREADPASSLWAADVVTMPSRDETFGLVAVEAMAAGRPLVATRVGGMPEVCGEHSGVRWVDAGDWQGLGRAIREALEEPQADRQARAAALRDRADCFSLPRYLERLQAAYADVLGRPDLLPLGWRREEAGQVEWERPHRPREIEAALAP